MPPRPPAWILKPGFIFQGFLWISLLCLFVWGRERKVIWKRVTEVLSRQWISLPQRLDLKLELDGTKTLLLRTCFLLPKVTAVLTLLPTDELCLFWNSLYKWIHSVLYSFAFISSPLSWGLSVLWIAMVHSFSFLYSITVWRQHRLQACFTFGDIYVACSLGLLRNNITVTMTIDDHLCLGAHEKYVHFSEVEPWVQLQDWA